MNYKDWEREVPESITGDVLWKMKVYRLALFAANLGWYDITNLREETEVYEVDTADIVSPPLV